MQRTLTLRGAAMALWCLLALPATAVADDTATKAKGLHVDLLPGYLPLSQLPDSLALIPPPPAAGSAAFAADKAAAANSLALRGTPRWAMATQDADLRFPAAAETFSCAVQAPVTEKTTPALYRLLRRSLTDVGLATYAAKNHYTRLRPFVEDAAPVCTPEILDGLKKDGSYPSGHTAIGWAWALILTEIAPDRADAILARGRAYGESRVVCNVHWQSDIEAGRIVGAAIVARLHADPAFLADVATAKQELATMRARHLATMRDCAAEAAAMAEHFVH